MKIFHILSGKANPNTLNGVNKVVDAISLQQKRIGYDVTVCGVANNTIKRHQPQYNLKLFVKSKIPFKYPSNLLPFLLENSDEDSVFHFHSAFILWYWPLVKALLKAGRPHIFLTPHGAYIPANMISLSKRIAFSFFDSKIIQNVEAVHIIGYHTENNYFVKSKAKRIVVIPNGCDSRFPNLNKNNNCQLVFGYMGRLAMKHKGLDALICAFADYKHKGGKGRLLLAGNGPDERRLTKIIDTKFVSDSVQLMGSLYGKEKNAFLQNISAFVSPSRWEGLPTACLEAAASGCPLLVTVDTNLGKYINSYHAGIVISATDRYELTRALFDFEKVYENDSEYKRTCLASKKMIEEELNWENITKRIVTELYGKER